MGVFMVCTLYEYVCLVLIGVLLILDIMVAMNAGLTCGFSFSVGSEGMVVPLRGDWFGLL